MTRVGLDTNVLVYALLEPDSDKGALGERLLLASAEFGVLPVQVLLETLAVARRKRPELLGKTTARISELSAIYRIAPTTAETLLLSTALTVDHDIHTYDALILTAVAQSGANLLLSEDMQDGQRIGGLRILNPFNPANVAETEALLA